MFTTAVTVAFASAGLAIADWSSSGSGSAVASVGGDHQVTLTAKVLDPVIPGASSTVSLTADNPSSSPVYVSSVSLTGVSADSVHQTCDTNDFSMHDVSEDIEVPPDATAYQLPNDGTFLYADTDVNQDACEGASLTLSLSSS